MTRFRSVANSVAQVARDAGRDGVRLIAVSKTVDIDTVREAMGEGATDFGENRPDELARKAEALAEPTWHFIGNIQSRRIPSIVAHADLIHSLSHHHHAEAISRAAVANGKTQAVLIEVNVSGEATKSGVRPEDALELVRFVAALPAVSVRGLMTMAPRNDAECARESFERLASLRTEIASALGDDEAREFTELSMGMSDDWEIAVECGATMVRIGRAIFDENYQEERN